jgi:hypothetical protein
VISLSLFLFLDFSLHLLLLNECLSVVKSLIEFLLEHFISYLFSFSPHYFECILCLEPLSLRVFCICIGLFLLIKSSRASKDLYLIYLYIRIKQIP